MTIILIGSKSSAQADSPRADNSDTAPPNSDTATPSLKQLNAHHPRLLINESILKNVRSCIQSNQLAAAEYQALQKRAQSILDEPPVQYHSGDLLEVSRLAMKRLYILGFIYQMKPDAKLAERARAEMLAICDFPSWHPDHFLDVAEITNALAIGYDWFYETLNDGDRARIRRAIHKLGLAPGMEAHLSKKYFWVTESDSNWCIVCYGGLLMGALSIANDDPETDKLASVFLPIAVDKLRQSFHHYEPDGAWVEGLGYWNYSTIYATSSLAALESSLGTDFGLSKTKGLREAGSFFIQAVSPNGKAFDFADAESGVRNSPQLFWLARRYDLPVLAYEERCLLTNHNEKLDVRDLIWFNTRGSIDDLKKLPLSATFGGATQQDAMRNSWTDKNSSFLAGKGGDNSSHHAHLELGTFVFDHDDERWIQQMGVENYDLPGYFDRHGGNSAPRWQYYRTKTAGQNTVVIDGCDQDASAKAFIEPLPRQKNADTNNFQIATLNLDQAYASRGISHFRRTFAVSRAEPYGALVADSISGNQQFEAVWQVHTKAHVDVRDNKAILSFGNKKMLMQVLSPTACHFTVTAINLPSPQLDTAGCKRLSVKATATGGKIRFAVLLLPFSGTEPTRLPKFPPVAEDN